MDLNVRILLFCVHASLYCHPDHIHEGHRRFQFFRLAHVSWARTLFLGARVGGYL